MKITIARNNKDNVPLVHETTWAEFVILLGEMAQEPIRGKDKEECKSKAIGLTACWFAGDGRRLKENAREASFIWLDCEDGHPGELQKAVTTLEGLGLESVIYTSAGHRRNPECKIISDRFRVIIPISSPINDHSDYRRIWSYLVRLLGVSVDAGKFAMYNLLYQPARYSSAAVNEFLHISGAVLSPAEWLSISPPLPTAAPVPTPLHTPSQDVQEAKVKALLEVIALGGTPSYSTWQKITYAAGKELGPQRAQAIMPSYFPEQKAGEYRKIFGSTYRPGESPGFGTLFMLAESFIAKAELVKLLNSLENKSKGSLETIRERMRFQR